MIGPFDPSGYPGERPDGPSLVLDGRTVPLRLDGPPEAPLSAPATAAVLEPGAVRWIVAYGANASPARLVDKGLDRRGAVLLPATMSGWVPAFETRRTHYGAVPLTLLPAPGVVAATWVLGIHHDDTGSLDDSEGAAYELGRVGDVIVAETFVLRDAIAYLPAAGARVQVVDGGLRTWPEHGQAAADRHLEAAGPSVPAPRIHQPITPPWPVTALAPRR